MDDQSLEKLKEETIVKCPKCFGQGFLPVDGKLYQCSCSKLFEDRIRMTEANLPLKYQTVDLLEQFVDKGQIGYRQVVDYVKNIDTAMKKGIGLYITGSGGSGKCLLGCAVLKAAIEKGYNGYFDTLQGIFDRIKDFDNPDSTSFIERLETCDILVMDKVRRIYKKSDFVGVKLGEILDKRDFNSKATIATDTSQLSTLNMIFDPSICDYFIEHCIQIVLTGENFAEKNLSKTLIRELKG